jgi:hypothetical protein
MTGARAGTGMWSRKALPAQSTNRRAVSNLALTTIYVTSFIHEYAHRKSTSGSASCSWQFQPLVSLNVALRAKEDATHSGVYFSGLGFRPMLIL